MVRLACIIKIYEQEGKEPLVIDFVHDIKIESSWREFTDTATIILPRIIDPEININSDKDFRARMLQWSKDHPVIEVFLGYEEPNHLAFKGIIRDVKGRVPVELVCEDHMYFLKSGLINTAFPQKDGDSLKTTNVLDFINIYFKVAKRATDIQYKLEHIQNINLGAFTLHNKTPVKFLEKLRDDYGLYSFIRYKKVNDVYTPFLHIGREYPREVDKKGFFRFYDNIIEDDLVYKEYDDVNIQVKYVLQGLKEEDKIEVVIPSKDKNIEQSEDVEVLEYKYFDPTFKNITDSFSDSIGDVDKIKKVLIELAQNKLYQLKYTGFRGAFTTFGDTLYTTSEGEKVGDFIRHGNVILLREQEKQGLIADIKRTDQLYFVDAVNYNYGLNGFRQEIHLGVSASDGTRVSRSTLSNFSIIQEGVEDNTTINVTIKNEVVSSQTITFP